MTSPTLRAFELIPAEVRLKPSMSIPLAERLRPKTLTDVIGQEHLLAEGKPLRTAIEAGTIPSLLFWGPPGVGKTTLARVIATYSGAKFVALSAVTSGVKDVREVARAARERKLLGAQTVLFLDEVHRFNKSQQDLLLPFVEDGTLVLIGATTENPSFEVNAALRSRTQLYVLQALDDEAIRAVLERALAHKDGFAGKLELADKVLDLIAAWSVGDARRALGGLELVAPQAKNGRVSEADAKAALSVKGAAFDKGGEQFYNLMSALHKSVRGSHVDASLYWLARLLRGGADPLYVARRLVRMASEDIGLADPNALRIGIAAKDAVAFLGVPEGELALAQAVVYLAVAPKSNAVYTAWKKTLQDADQFSHLDVPLQLRNAPTKLMKELDYGGAYAYYFDDPEGSFTQSYLPDKLARREYYAPLAEGWEQKVKVRLERLRDLHKKGVSD